MVNKIIIVGGGASGMIAAIVAKRNGAEVVLLERNDRVGKKLLATGNGRCNYTNMSIDIENYHGSNPNFVIEALSQFDRDSTIEFFEGLGITPATEDSGKVFPLSFQSSSMLDVLRLEMKYLGIELITEAQVTEIIKKKRFSVKLKDGRVFDGDKVILATGGMAMPVSGSDGNGYNLAKKLGHKLVNTFPALVQLKLDGSIFKQINGVKFVGIVALYHKGKLLTKDTGDILFTDYGISGPPILQISRKAIEFLNKGEKVELKLSIIHTRTFDELFTYLINRFQVMPWKTVEEGLIGIINKRLIIPVLKELNIDKNKSVEDLSKKEIESLANLLISWSFNVIGHQSWGHAQTTAGGINTDDINNSTMESKIVEGLYIIGELLDIDGDCGGYNLQWAWSSGYIAGLNAAL